LTEAATFTRITFSSSISGVPNANRNVLVFKEQYG
jgi:hypothetical protein